MGVLMPVGVSCEYREWDFIIICSRTNLRRWLRLQDQFHFGFFSVDNKGSALHASKDFDF